MNDTLQDIFTDPIATELLGSSIPARVGYDALDGTPRVVPIGFHWDGARFHMFTHPDAPKVKALRANPQVALTIDTESFPPHVLLVRGTVTVDIEDGVPDDYLTASRKSVPAEMWPDFEAGVRQAYQRMARITLTPAWAKILDFVTRAPQVLSR